MWSCPLWFIFRFAHGPISNLLQWCAKAFLDVIVLDVVAFVVAWLFLSSGGFDVCPHDDDNIVVWDFSLQVCYLLIKEVCFFIGVSGVRVVACLRSGLLFYSLLLCLFWFCWGFSGLSLGVWLCRRWVFFYVWPSFLPVIVPFWA